MSLEPIHRASYFSCFESSNSCLQSKWFVVALAVSSFIFLGAVAFGGMGLFASQLPQWLAHAVGTVGHSGCLAMFMWGTVLGGACAITAIVLMVKRSCSLPTSRSENLQTPNPEVREAEVTPPNEESEALNAGLIGAAINGRVEEITTLLARGANVEATNLFGATPLIRAAHFGHVEVVAALLNHGANLEARDQFGKNPLIYAASCDHVEVVAALLDHGANIEARDRSGDTPLILATVNGHANVVRILRQRGASILSFRYMMMALFMRGFSRLDADQTLLHREARRQHRS